MNINKPPILYSFRRCPYAMRARLALALAGVTVEHREIVLRNKPVAMLLASPKGTVPVLVLPDARVIEESMDIIRRCLPQPCFTEQEQAMLAINDGAFKSALDRYKYASRSELQREGETAEDARDEAVQFLQSLDVFLHGYSRAQFSPFQCATLPFVRQFRGVDPAWFDSLGFTALHQQLQAFLVSSLFQRVMKKYPPWQEGDEPLYIAF